MTKTIKYTGAQQRWSELPYTGAQSLWAPGQIEERSDVAAAALMATGLFYEVQRQLDNAEVMALRSLVSSAGIGGGATYTREQLRLLAEANGLKPGSMYRTTEGVIAFAKTERFLNSRNWFSSSQRWNSGSNTSYTTRMSVMLPPIDVAGGLDILTAGQMTGSTRTKRMAVVLGGTTSDAPGTAGVNVTAFERNFNSATLQYAWETLTRLRCMGSAARLAVRNVGASASGIDSSGSGISGVGKRFLSMDLSASKLLRVATLISKVGAGVSITSTLQISGGYAYGTVAAGTFGDTASLARTAQITGATGADAAFYNLDPVDIELLTTGLPSPVLATDATDLSTVTLFRYPVTGGSAAATGTPLLWLYDDLTVDQFSVAIDQGAG